MLASDDNMHVLAEGARAAREKGGEEAVEKFFREVNAANRVEEETEAMALEMSRRGENEPAMSPSLHVTKKSLELYAQEFGTESALLLVTSLGKLGETEEARQQPTDGEAAATAEQGTDGDGDGDEGRECEPPAAARRGGSAKRRLSAVEVKVEVGRVRTLEVEEKLASMLPESLGLDEFLSDDTFQDAVVEAVQNFQEQRQQQGGAVAHE